MSNVNYYEASGLDVLEVVKETAKAYLVQWHFGAGSDPEHNAREYWVPKSQVKIKEFPSSMKKPRFKISHAAKWWVVQNELFDCFVC